MIKSTKGFTLVELIVVIAILAILAGVAIPVYNGYITKAQDAAIVTKLDAIMTAAQAANATAGQVDTIAITKNGAVTVTPVDTDATATGNQGKLADTFYSDFATFCPSAAVSGTSITVDVDFDQSKTYANGATWHVAADPNGTFAAGWNANPAA